MKMLIPLQHLFCVLSIMSEADGTENPAGEGRADAHADRGHTEVATLSPIRRGLKVTSSAPGFGR